MGNKIDLKVIAERFEGRVLFPESLSDAKKYLSKMSKQTETYIENIDRLEDSYDKNVQQFKNLIKRERNQLRGMTVGQLKKILEESDLPDDALVVAERITDYYFNKGGWGVYLRKSIFWHDANKFNDQMEAELRRIKNGEERHYSMEDPSKFITDKDGLDLLHDQFHVVEGAYSDKEENLLLIHSHY